MDSKDVVGKTCDCNAHDLIYGGVLDAYNIIVSVITKEESDRQIKMCEARIKEILA
ncbi:MAG: hypothetical protein C5S48_02450 [Candidatus Methanogaster sp.]|nr:MAG: hypothetical protein C5S48_02450 [ANME-2 cluster archaeon]